MKDCERTDRSSVSTVGRIADYILALLWAVIFLAALVVVSSGCIDFQKADGGWRGGVGVALLIATAASVAVAVFGRIKVLLYPRRTSLATSWSGSESVHRSISSCFAVISLGFICFGIAWSIVDGVLDPVVGVASLLLTLVGIWMLRIGIADLKRPVLLLDKRGITDHVYGFIAWRDINAIRLFVKHLPRGGKVSYLLLHTSKKNKHLSGLARWRSLLERIRSAGTGYKDVLVIEVDGLTSTPSYIAEAAERLHHRAWIAE